MSSRLRERPLSEVDWNDVVAFIRDDDVPEGLTLEYKSALPHKDQKQPDTVPGDPDDLGRRAVDKILEEVLAFANTNGGYLLLGVREDPNRPGYPERITPYPECVEVADRLRKQCRDLVDPEIPGLEISAVCPADADKGIVIVQVPRSRRAPHRNERTSECFVRRSDRSEKMAMREIQRLTLDRVSELNAIDQQLDDRIEAFRLWATKTRGEFAYSLCATAVPLDQLTVPYSVYRPAVGAPGKDFRATKEARELKLPSLIYGATEQWRPIIRGAQCEGDNDRVNWCFERRESGMIEYRLGWRFEAPERAPPLHPEWFLAIAANCMRDVNIVRSKCGTPNGEYVLQLQLNVYTPIIATSYSRPYPPDTVGEVLPDHVVFPKYPLGSLDSFPDQMRVIEMDFWHYVGRDGYGPEIDLAVSEFR